LRLDLLAFNTPATISHIDWAAVSDKEGRRLRELGFEAGMAVEALHGGFFAGLLSGGPLACRIGRMTVAIRRSHAAAIEVSPS
jgi:ferrous iron transport protein A